MKRYAKFIVLAITATLASIVPALADNSLDASELVNGLIVGLGAIGVYIIPNLDEGIARYFKFGVAFLTAGAVALNSALTDGVTMVEWLQIGLAAFGAVGLYIIPNGSPDPSPLTRKIVELSSYDRSILAGTNLPTVVNVDPEDRPE